MHDISELNRRGIHGLFVASAEFVEAAAAQSAALGYEPEAVYVPHPIQDRTDAEMQGIADAAFEVILVGLTS